MKKLYYSIDKQIYVVKGYSGLLEDEIIIKVYERDSSKKFCKNKYIGKKKFFIGAINSINEQIRSQVIDVILKYERKQKITDVFKQNAQ